MSSEASSRLPARSRDGNAALFADLYELTMMQAYYAEAMTAPAVFELHVRALPPQRNFLLAAGLEDALGYLESVAFSADELSYLESLRLFTPAFIERLRGFRFAGSVRAVPEGTVIFGGEPLLEVTASLPEAQFVETYLLNQLSFQTLVASKGARSVLAARGSPVIDFGQRRTHGTDAGLKAARALYLAGFAATSSLVAGHRYGIPVTGTMGHSYVQAHVNEREAFERFARQYAGTVLLVDTYDTEAGVRRAIATIRELPVGVRPRALRIDSGDLHALSRLARAQLDAAGLPDVGIVVSGGLDEYQIAQLIEARAPIAAYAVGTHVGTSADAPTLDTAYKLVEYAGIGRAKFSVAKATLPGTKQVYRQVNGGKMRRDLVTGVGEHAQGTALLIDVMRHGQRLSFDSSLEAARGRAQASLAALPAALSALSPAKPAYPVAVSRALLSAREEIRVAALSRSDDDWR